MTTDANIQTYSDKGIDIPPGRTTGQVNSTCPECSLNRKKGNQNKKCLSISLDKGVWNCKNCGWTGSLNKKTYSLPIWENKTNLSDKVVEWFLKRNVAQATLLEMKITEQTEFMPQVSAERNVICFPYFRDSKLVNIKFRDATEKNFKLYKDAELIFYNYDAIKNATEIYIVEGEIDALTMIGAGYKNTISVPNGAHPKNNNLQFVNSKDFQSIEKIFIATDNDGPGDKLAEDLAKRLGIERSFRAKFQEKDVNDLLCKSGKITFDSFIPFSELIECDELPSREKLKMSLSYEKKNNKPALLLGALILINFGELFVIIGLPGQGKSAIVEAIIAAFFGIASFKFQFNSRGLKALVIDSERPPDDVYDSYHNIFRRMGLNPDKDLDRLDYLTLSEFGKPDELKCILEREVTTGEYELVVLDGIIDFSHSFIDDKDSAEVVRWARALAVKWNVALVVTMHPNKGTEVVAGHLGAFLYRWARALLFVRSVKGNKSIKELTGEPDMSKLSHADLGTLEPIYFSWDAAKNLLMPCDYEPTEDRGQEDKMRSTFKAVLPDGKRLRSSELVKLLQDMGKSKRTATRWMEKAVEKDILNNTNAIYSLTENGQ